MKRVVCLYRVSTKGQVSKEDDIPIQKVECQRFTENMPDWKIVKEYSEKGVSGYKVSVDDRDAIQEIRIMAEKRQFDILLVFMFDRLGRREQETPFLVEWFVDQGIEVWSTREGQTRIENRSDKLINYIRYWTYGGESEKISIRVKAAHQQMIENGIWRGGLKPYGYTLVHNGRVGKKNRPLYDLVIDEFESEVVRFIFDAVCHKGIGTHTLSNMLNDKYPSSNKVWVPMTIRGMLKNPIYTGRLKFNEYLAEPQESLRIISDSQFELAGRALESRIPRRLSEKPNSETGELEPSLNYTFGGALLSGILYCGHCDHKLVGTYHTKHLKDHDYRRPVYRCYNGATKAKACEGARTYSALKLDDLVLSIVRQYFHTFKSQIDSVWKEQARMQMVKQQDAKVKILVGKLEKLIGRREMLKDEIVKSIEGTSQFDAATIKELIERNDKAIEEANEELSNAQNARNDNEYKLRILLDHYKHINDWAEVFDLATDDEKKMILTQLIKKITVKRGYKVTIYFFITMQEFVDAITNKYESEHESLAIRDVESL